MGTKKRVSVRDVNRGSDQHLRETTTPDKTKESLTYPIIVPVVIGLDISTTCTGVTVLHAKSGELIKMFAIRFGDKDIEDFWDKVEHAKKELYKNIDLDWEIKGVAVEENAKRFTPGFSSADTILTLAKFNGILCHLMYQKFNVKPTCINVRSARAKLGIKIDTKNKTKSTKDKVLEYVVAMNPNFPWIKREVKGIETLVKINQDLADSWVIAAAARKMYPNLTK